MSSTRNFALAASAALLVLASCKGAEQVCNPTDPLCGGGGGGAAVASIAVTSPVVDTVMAASRTAQLTAVARAASGSALSAQPTFAWTSLNTATATVGASTGLVTGVAPGTVTIRASQSTNTVTGDVIIRVVNADPTLVNAVVADTLADALRQALTTTPRTSVATGLTTCATHAASGNLLALNTCLTNLTTVSGGTNGNDNAVLGVLDLFFDFARRQLNL